MVKVEKYGLFELHANCRRRGKSNTIAINAHVTHTENSVLRSVLSARFKSSMAGPVSGTGHVVSVSSSLLSRTVLGIGLFVSSSILPDIITGGAGKAWAACTTAGTVVTCNKDSNPVTGHQQHTDPVSTINLLRGSTVDTSAIGAASASSVSLSGAQSGPKTITQEVGSAVRLKSLSGSPESAGLLIDQAGAGDVIINQHGSVSVTGDRHLQHGVQASRIVGGNITVNSTGDIATDGRYNHGILTTHLNGNGNTIIDSSGTIKTTGDGSSAILGVQGEKNSSNPGTGDINISQHGSGAIDTAGDHAHGIQAVQYGTGENNITQQDSGTIQYNG